MKEKVQSFGRSKINPEAPTKWEVVDGLRSMDDLLN